MHLKRGCGDESSAWGGSPQLLIHSLPHDFGLRDPTAGGFLLKELLQRFRQIDGGALHAIYGAICQRRGASHEATSGKIRTDRAPAPTSSAACALVMIPAFTWMVVTATMIGRPVAI